MTITVLEPEETIDGTTYDTNNVHGKVADGNINCASNPKVIERFAPWMLAQRRSRKVQCKQNPKKKKLRLSWKRKGSKLLESKSNKQEMLRI